MDGSHLLTDSEYSAACEAVQCGKLERLTAALEEACAARGCRLSSLSLLPRAKDSSSSLLFLAAIHDSVEIVDWLLGTFPSEFLIETDQTGRRTAMHQAAALGKNEVVKCLLDHGISPFFPDPSSPPFPHQDYIPCPLFMAAVRGKEDTMAQFLHLSTCPPSCAADAYLLYGAYHAELPGFEALHWESWSEAFSTRNSTPLPCYTLLPSYDHERCSEISTRDELSRLSATGSPLEVFQQCLLIRQRCLGDRNPQNFDILTRIAEEASLQGSFEESEQFLLKAVALLVSSKLSDLKKGAKLSNVLKSDILAFVKEPIAAILVFLVDSGFTPQFSKYTEGFLHLLETVHSRAEETGGCEEEELLRQLFDAVLFLFNIWLYHCSRAQGESEAEDKTREQCEEMGRQLVSKYLVLKNGPTLLHLAIQRLNGIQQICATNKLITGKLGPFRRWSRNSTVLLESLLQWGGWRALNKPVQPDGNRPLHEAAVRPAAAEVVSLLLSYGAHHDAVNGKGVTPSQLLPWYSSAEIRALLVPSPQPLVCQAAHVILCSGVDYLNLSCVPPRLKEFITMHNPVF